MCFLIWRQNFVDKFIPQTLRSETLPKKISPIWLQQGVIYATLAYLSVCVSVCPKDVYMGSQVSQGNLMCLSRRVLQGTLYSKNVI